jgi:hypothetical protein
MSLFARFQKAIDPHSVEFSFVTSCFTSGIKPAHGSRKEG